MKTLLVAPFTMFSVLALGPQGLAAPGSGGETVVAGIDQSDSEHETEDGAGVSDGSGTVSFTSTGGSGAVWKKQDGEDLYTRKAPKGS